MSKKELSKSEIFKNIMSGFQSLAIITSLPVAAYWAYKTFNATNQARLSEIELREKEVAFKDKGSLNIGLQSELFFDANKRIIYTTVVIKNNGNTTETFAVQGHQFSAFHLSKANTDTPQISKRISMQIEHPGGEALEHTLHSGESADLHFITHAAEAGLYSFEFHIPIEDENSDNKNTGEVWKYIGSGKILIPDE